MRYFGNIELWKHQNLFEISRFRLNCTPFVTFLPSHSLNYFLMHDGFNPSSNSRILWEPGRGKISQQSSCHRPCLDWSRPFYFECYKCEYMNDGRCRHRSVWAFWKRAINYTVERKYYSTCRSALRLYGYIGEEDDSQWHNRQLTTRRHHHRDEFEAFFSGPWRYYKFRGVRKGVAPCGCM